MYMVLVLNVLKMGQRIYHQRNQEPGKQLKVKSLLSYFGRIAKYDSESHHHYVEYEDSDEKLVTLSKELIKFHVSLEEIKCLRLTCDLHCSETDYLDVNEMILLTANLDDCHDIEPGDIIWDKLTGSSFWMTLPDLKSLTFWSIVLKKACCSVGVILPVYSTFKAIETNNITGQQKMLLY
nr:histone-lysine N-methyltransferase ATX2-like isoform X1 [Tanacetum cinerariifolium]